MECRKGFEYCSGMVSTAAKRRDEKKHPSQYVMVDNFGETTDYDYCKKQHHILILTLYPADFPLQNPHQ